VKLYCIGDEDTVRGFRMAGVHGRVVTTPEDAVKAITETASRNDCALIVVTPDVAAGALETIQELRLERDRPLVVELPVRGRSVSGRKNLRQLAQEALGVQLGT
jgi:V/A-type H+-transporting ATPase subunit F